MIGGHRDNLQDVVVGHAIAINVIGAGELVTINIGVNLAANRMIGIAIVTGSAAG
jgi:hypothetical protein